MVRGAYRSGYAPLAGHCGESLSGTATMPTPSEGERMKDTKALLSLGLAALIACGLAQRSFAQPSKPRPFTQRLFTDTPSIEPTTPQAKRLAEALRKDLLAPLSLKVLKSKVASVKRKRFVTSKEIFSASDAPGPIITGSVKTQQGRLFVTFIQKSDGTILGLVDSFAVSPSRRGATGKRVGELERLGFKVNKIVLLYQIAYWRKRAGDSVARTVTHAPEFVTPPLNPKEAMGALNVKASASPKARGAKATTQSADIVPPAVVMAVASSHEPETPVVSHPEGTPSGPGTSGPDTSIPTGPPATAEPVTTGTPPDAEPPSDCILETVDGILKQCCKTPYSIFHNCTAFAHEFNEGCAERDLSCKSVDIKCDGAVPHRANILMLSDGSWVPVEPQPNPRIDASRSIGVMPGVRLSGPEVPTDVACKMVGLTPDDCGCVQDEAPGGGTQCNCVVEVLDHNPKPNSDPDYCADSYQNGIDPFTGRSPDPAPASSPSMDHKRYWCLKCCVRLAGQYEDLLPQAERGNWRRSCETQCALAFTQTEVPADPPISD